MRCKEILRTHHTTSIVHSCDEGSFFNSNQLIFSLAVGKFWILLALIFSFKMNFLSVFLFLGCVIGVFSTKPCCQGSCSANGSGLAKYYSIDSFHNMCGECCMEPSQYPVYKLFEPGLTAANNSNPCAEKGYDNYSPTVTHGFGPVKMTLDLYGPSPALGSSVVALEATEPCCQGNCSADGSGLAKYYSIDTMHNMCGECCMKPSQYPLYKIFEPGLTAAGSLGLHPCAEKGYDSYSSTVTHGFGPVKMTLDLYGPSPALGSNAGPTVLDSAEMPASYPTWQCDIGVTLSGFTGTKELDQPYLPSYSTAYIGALWVGQQDHVYHLEFV